MDPDMINCVILAYPGRFKKLYNSQPCHLAANQCKSEVWEVKKKKKEATSVLFKLEEEDEPKIWNAQVLSSLN